VWITTVRSPNSPRRANQFIPNPCDHIMFEPLCDSSIRVETRIPAGELAGRGLMLDDEALVAQRELILEVIAAPDERKRRLQQCISTMVLAAG